MRKWILAVLLLAPLLAWAGRDEAIETYRTGDYAGAMSQFKALAAEGDTVAMYYVAILYDRGYGVPVDHAEAAKWFEKGAVRGDSLSAYHLGKMLETGKWVAKDPVGRAHVAEPVRGQRTQRARLGLHEAGDPQARARHDARADR